MVWTGVYVNVNLQLLKYSVHWDKYVVIVCYSRVFELNMPDCEGVALIDVVGIAEKVAWRA